MKHAFPRLAALFLAAVLSACGGADQNPQTASIDVGQARQQHRPGEKTASTDQAPDAYATVVQQLYVSYFGRPADYNGLIGFENALAAANAPTDLPSLFNAYGTNAAIKSLVDSFGNSAESAALYGGGTTTEFVAAIFKNVLGRAPAQAGLDFWVNAIDTGLVSKGNAALGIMVGALSNNTAQGLLDAKLIDNRVAVAVEFTSLMSSPADIYGYRGSAAAAVARSMLASVTANTDSYSFYDTIGITVSSLARYPVNVTVTGLDAGSTVTFQNNGTDNLVVSANSSSTFATAMTSGASYAVTVANQPPGQFCHVINGSPPITSADTIEVAVFCVAPHAYVLNYNALSASQFSLASNGSLSAMVMPTVSTVEGPLAIAIDRTGKYAYVTSSGAKAISQFTFDANRNLVPLTTPTVASGKYTSAITIDPTSRFAYAINYLDSTVSEYSIGPDGGLSQIGSLFVIVPEAMAIEPGGKYLYLADSSGNVYQYAISPQGLLVPLSPATVASPISSTAMVIDAQGKNLYVTASGGGSDGITQYRIGADGTLTRAGSTTLVTASDPKAIAIDPSGKYAYVAQLFANYVSQFSIGDDGSLTPLATPTVATGGWPTSIAFDPTGKFVYVANNRDGTIYQYDLGSDGDLVPVTETIGASDSYPSAIVIY